jgi:hypothetical protein
MDVALARAGEVGYAKSTGGLHEVNGGNNDLPVAWKDGKMRGVYIPIGWAGKTALPQPNSRRIAGFSLKEHNINVMRPFTGVCAEVSLPLLMRSI